MVAIRVLTSDSEFDRLVTVRFRTCTECHALKRLTAFVPIKGCRGHYGRCRTCRAAAAMQRYHSSEQVRIAEIERARRNRRRGSSAAAWSSLETGWGSVARGRSGSVGLPAFHRLA